MQDGESGVQQILFAVRANLNSKRLPEVQARNAIGIKILFGMRNKFAVT